MPGFSDTDREELLHVCLQATEKPVNLTHARPTMLCIHLVKLVLDSLCTAIVYKSPVIECDGFPSILNGRVQPPGTIVG